MWNFQKKKIWHAAKSQFDLIKIENLFWKLLYQKLKIEINWYWLEKIKKICFIHDQIFTIYYIFFECFVVDAMWQEIKNVWIYLCFEKIKIFQNVSKLIVYMTFCSLKTTNLNKRKWNIVFRTTIWIIWKIYLFHSFQNSIRYWNFDATMNLYKKILKNHIFSERILNMKKKYRNKHYNVKIFKKFWKQWFNEIRLILDFKCFFKFIFVHFILTNENSNFVNEMKMKMNE